MYSWLRQRLHISWHIAGLSAGIIVGSAAAPILPNFFADDLWLVVAAILLVAVILSQRRWLCLAACLAGGCIGAWRGVNERLSLQVYQPYYGQLVQISGVLREDTSYGQHGDQRFELSEVRLLDSPRLQGKAWISIAQKADLKRGDTVTVQGKLGEGFGTLPASMYRATIMNIERPHPGDMARIFRDWFAAGVREGVPEPQASLGIGYLTGQRSALPASLDEQLRTVGLTHAVVASGYNLTILVSFARNLLAAASKYTATLAAGLMVVLFMLVTGFSPSMIRAGLVSGLSLATWYCGRVIHPSVLVPLAAAVTVLLRPAYAWGDIGWCLSFAAFAGVIVLAPLLHHYFWAESEKPPMILRLVIETVAAQLVTLPIILHSFGQYAAYALPANLLVIPLVPLAMASTFVAGIVGLVAPGLAHLAGWPATFVLRYMTWVVEHIASLPGASEEITFNTVGLTAAYALLSLLTIWLWRKTGHDFRDTKS
jgi:competence protein ComEC